MDAKVNTANKRLKALYEPCFDNLCTKNHTSDKHFNPLLIKCPEHYFDNGNVRIMVIGDTTTKWYRDYTAKSVDDCIHYYEAYYDQTNKKRIGCEELFRFMESINMHISDTMDNIVMTNVYKTTDNIKMTNAIPGRAEECSKWRQMHLEITAKEIEYLTPDFVFFLTGNDLHSDSSYINGTLGWDLHFVPFKENTNFALVVGTKKKLDFVCCRLPKPADIASKDIELLAKIITNYKPKSNVRKYQSA